jgi:hypothetical protein
LWAELVGADFTERLQELAAAGRPVEALSKLDDDALGRIQARVTVFPSLNEGFGLPVGESIAAGTPAITSNFGSMREIAEGGGALMVDPRNDHQLTEALRSVLTDDHVHRALWRRVAVVPRTAGTSTPTGCGGWPRAKIPAPRTVPGRLPRARTISRNRRADGRWKV